MQGGEHQVTSQRGVNRDGRRLQVTNLTQHHHIGRLTQHGTERIRESQIHRSVHLNLINTFQLVLNRILHRDDLPVRFVNVVETGIKRGRLAGTCRPGHQQDAVRQLNQILKRLLVICEESQLTKTKF